MSLILDALKRAERERAAERNSALADVPMRAGARAPRRRYWRVAAIALVVAMACALAWTLLRDRPAAPRAPEPEAGQSAAPGQAEPAPEAAQPRSAPETPPGVVPMPAPAAPTARAAQPPPAVVPGTEGVATLDDLTADPVEPHGAPAPATEMPAPEPAPPATAAAPETAPEEPSEAEAPSRPIPPALTQAAPLRKFREMSPEFRADFPALTIEVHVYERAPGRRFVIVNGRRYREGERLAEGPQIVEIVKTGIVLEYRGEKVLYTIGR